MLASDRTLARFVLRHVEAAAAPVTFSELIGACWRFDVDAGAEFLTTHYGLGSIVRELIDGGWLIVDRLETDDGWSIPQLTIPTPFDDVDRPDRLTPPGSDEGPTTSDTSTGSDG